MPEPRTVVTLRARWSGDEPAPGLLMASQTGKTVYRIVAVVRLRTAGDPNGYRYRLVCARLGRAEVPDGVPIAPWRWDRRVARSVPLCELAADRRLEPGEVAERVRAARRQGELAQRARAARVGQEPPRGRGDFGPAIRRKAARDDHGRLLREPDVEVITAVDPRSPLQRLRRARRCDPLARLLNEECTGRRITLRELEAAEQLRDDLEYVTPPVGGGFAEVHVSPFQYGMSQRHITSAHEVRQAAAAVGAVHWPAVLWVCLGGTISGYADYRHIDRKPAADLVRDGLRLLATHCFGHEDEMAA